MGTDTVMAAFGVGGVNRARLKSDGMVGGGIDWLEE